MGLNQTKKVLHSEGNYSEKKKKSLLKGEDICKWYIHESNDIQNIRGTYTTQYQKQIKNPIINRERIWIDIFSKEDRQRANTHMKTL